MKRSGGPDNMSFEKPIPDARNAELRQEKGLSDVPNDRKPGAQAQKILLVEDSFENRDMLTRRLQRRGFTVCSAADGPTGVAMSVSEKPDVILMDVALGAPMATSNSPTFGQSNSSRQDGRIISRLMCPWPCALRPP